MRDATRRRTLQDMHKNSPHPIPTAKRVKGNLRAHPVTGRASSDLTRPEKPVGR